METTVGRARGHEWSKCQNSFATKSIAWETLDSLRLNEKSELNVRLLAILDSGARVLIEQRRETRHPFRA